MLATGGEATGGDAERVEDVEVAGEVNTPASGSERVDGVDCTELDCEGTR